MKGLIRIEGWEHGSRIEPIEIKCKVSEVGCLQKIYAAAPDLLAALETLVEAMPEIDSDEELSGADAVEWLSINWHMFKAAIAKAKGLK